MNKKVTSFEELKTEWEKDSKLTGDCDHDLAQIGNVLYKYQNYLFEANKVLCQLRNYRARLVHILRRYYCGKATQKELIDLERSQFLEKILKNEIQGEIEADPLYQKTMVRVQHSESIIEYLHHIVKHLHSRGYNIKAIIEYKKFTGGMQ